MKNKQQLEIQIGDIVHLNSGSPDLKVISVMSERVAVQWDGGQGETRNHEFPRACLTPTNSK
jgi:uncharacterized protein YodC (DUF2158 family)